MSPAASDSLAVMEAARDIEIEINEMESDSTSEGAQGLMHTQFQRAHIVGDSVVVAGEFLVALAVLHRDGVRVASFVTDEKNGQ